MTLTKIGVIAGILFAMLTSADAQTKTDDRVSPIEMEYLAQQAGHAMQQAAHAAALLTIEKQDHQAAEGRSAKVQAEMEYWRAYAGFAPTAEPAPK